MTPYVHSWFSFPCSTGRRGHTPHVNVLPVFSSPVWTQGLFVRFVDSGPTLGVLREPCQPRPQREAARPWAQTPHPACLYARSPLCLSLLRGRTLKPLLPHQRGRLLLVISVIPSRGPSYTSGGPSSEAHALCGVWRGSLRSVIVGHVWKVLNYVESKGDSCVAPHPALRRATGTVAGGALSFFITERRQRGPSTPAPVIPRGGPVPARPSVVSELQEEGLPGLEAASFAPSPAPV